MWDCVIRSETSILLPRISKSSIGPYSLSTFDFFVAGLYHNSELQQLIHLLIRIAEEKLGINFSAETYH
jgi:hypothetical protein